MDENKKNSYDLGNGMHASGRYDRIFFGCYAETNTFDIRCRFDLRQKLNRARLQKAADAALKNYPEFAVRPVVRDGKLCYEKNTKPVKLCNDDNSMRCFGSDGPDGTNGYLFLFLCGEKHFTLSLYHAQTDAYGMISYVISVLWNYAKTTFPPIRFIRTSFFDPYGVRLTDLAFRAMDDEERYDAVSKFGADGKLFDPYAGREFFPLPPEAHDKNDMSCRLVNLVISNTDFLKKTVELHTSYGPLLAALAAQAIDSLYDIGDKVIAVVLTGDSRRFFRSKTLSNMAYNMPLTLGREELDLPLESICGRLRVQTLNQLKKSHVRETMKGIVKIADDVDKLGPIDAVAKYLAGPEGLKVQNEKTTIFLTYPGMISTNPISKLLIKRVTPGMLAMDRAINAYCHGDDLVIQFSLKSDDLTLPKAMKKVLDAQGFDAVMLDMGRVTQNMLAFDKIKKIQTEAPAAQAAASEAQAETTV